MVTARKLSTLQHRNWLPCFLNIVNKILTRLPSQTSSRWQDINDLQTVCEHIKYVDDCTIWEASSSSGMDSSLQIAADEVRQWTASNKMALNYKTKELRICFKKSTPDIALLTINGRPIQQVNSTRLLGVALSEDLKWQSHIDEITTKASQHLYFIILLKRASIDPHHLININRPIGIGVRMPSVAHEPL